MSDDRSRSHLEGVRVDLAAATEELARSGAADDELIRMHWAGESSIPSSELVHLIGRRAKRRGEIELLRDAVDEAPWLTTDLLRAWIAEMDEAIGRDLETLETHRPDRLSHIASQHVHLERAAHIAGRRSGLRRLAIELSRAE